MLKHASNAGAGPAVNTTQLRNNLIIAITTQQQQQQSVTTATNTTARSIHLRPQQPLNVFTSVPNLQSTATAAGSVITTTTTTTTNSGTTINGGQRSGTATATSAGITPLLNIASSPLAGIGGSGCSGAGLLPAVQANNTITTTPLTLNTPLTSNGGLHHHHIYTNQHMLASNTNANHNTTTGTTTITTKNNINNANNTTTLNATAANATTTFNNQNNYSNYNNLTGGVLVKQQQHATKHSSGPGPREALTSLGLLCLVSLLLALLSLIFLLKISPNGREQAALSRPPHEDFVIVYDVTLALCAMSLSLNLCCLLVCSIQFLFAVKLVRSPIFDGRDNKYLEKSSVSRTCAVGGFFISIPIFLTGIILYTFNHFHSTPAIITSVLIGIGIVFCGGAMVHNVFVWQKEKTISYRNPPLNMSMMPHVGRVAPPLQFLSHASNYAQHCSSPLDTQLNGNFNSTLLHTQSQLAAPQQQHPHFNFNHFQQTSVTPVSPNHSQGSFNHASFLLRPSTATPPTPKPTLPSIPNGCISSLANGGCSAAMAAAREASGSVSPGMPALDMSNMTNPSLHELSTLV